MGTNSTISKLEKDGTVKSIKCHFDGYYNHNGKRLFEFYKNEEDIDELIKLGDLVSLGEHLNPPDENYDFSRALDDKITCAGYRDEDEDEINFKEYKSLDDYFEAFFSGNLPFYNYIWIDREWYVCDRDNILPNNKLNNLKYVLKND